MKIISLESYDAHSSLKIERVFFDDFTLLVGASGVGKTQILQTIVKIKNIASGASISGFSWRVEFQTTSEDKSIYLWEGEFEALEGYDRLRDEEFAFLRGQVEAIKPVVLKETLSLHGSQIIKRDAGNIIFNNEKIIKLSPSESVINLLRVESDISPIYKSFRHVCSIDEDKGSTFYTSWSKTIEKENYTIDEIRDSNTTINAKLFLCKKYQPDYFSRLINSYKDIFPFVEDVDVELFNPDKPRALLPSFHFIKIKEKNITTWIYQKEMSSGMFKTLIQLSFIYLSSDGTIFLIDEFENGFGVNCINDITDFLVDTGNDVQFIITSHHPYIINHIPVEHWKIISRAGGVIKSYDAKDYGLDESNHESFTKLINLDIYSDGANG